MELSSTKNLVKHENLTWHDVLHVTGPSRKLFNAIIQQAPEALLVFNEFLRREKFDRVIEIGTAWGGLSIFLSLACFMHGMEFYTFDIEGRHQVRVGQLLHRLGSKYKRLNVFRDKGIAEIRSLIEPEGRVLLLCDGGSKKKEIQIFSPFLKVGDVIMGHDYFHSQKHFKQQDRWLSCELTWADIDASATRHNLKQIYTDIFPRVFWVCLIKEGHANG